MNASGASRPPSIVRLRFLLAAFACAALVYFDSCSSVSSAASSAFPPGVYARYEVRISDPASGTLEARLEYPAELLRGRQYLDLMFWDLRSAPERLPSFGVRSDGEALKITRLSGAGANARRIDLAKNTGPVIVEYRMDPSYFPPGADKTVAADAVARIAKEAAVLRTGVCFPITKPDGFPIKVEFRLPDGWIAVTPWPADGDGFLVSTADQAIEYIALGPFRVRELDVGQAMMRAAVYAGVQGADEETAAAVLGYVVERFGEPPGGGKGVFSAAILPPGFMHGGSSGQRSVVQTPDAITLTHEIFHWWNKSERIPPEAGWFCEGFTEYYGIKIARDAGLVGAAEADEAYADLNGEMRFLENGKPRGLAENSRRLMSDNYARRLVYSKGALFALRLDRLLGEKGRSLDEAMKAVFSDPRASMRNSELRAVFHDVFGGLVDAEFDAYVSGANSLPDLGFGPATGRSGVARYLPGR